jgi:transposase
LSIDRFVDLSGIRAHLRPFYSEIGRPSIDPELMIRILSSAERRLCEEVHLNLAYRWFCRLGLEGDVPDHSTSHGDVRVKREYHGGIGMFPCSSVQV